MVRSNILNTMNTFKNIFLLILLSIISNNIYAQDPKGQWHISTEDWSSNTAPTNQYLSQLEKIEKLPRTGGQFLYVGDFKITSANRYVFDFAYTTFIGLFEHRIYNDKNLLIGSYHGGIQSDISNPYPIRHGRPVPLSPGDYKLVVNLSSPFFINSPEPLIQEELDYLQSIKIGNLIAYIGIGIFFAMAIFYLCFAISRQSISDLAYTTFIVGNLIFNLMALNIAPDLFGANYFQLSTNAIFISNIAYLFFVRDLLQIKKETDPSLYNIGSALVVLFIIFAIIGTLFDSLALELSRAAVAIFIGYGLFAGLTYALQKVTLAYYYLIANLCFLIPATISIWPEGFDAFSNPTLYSAHMGIIAVSIEVLLLGLVQAYQINQMNHERLIALDKAEYSQKAARTDPLTGAPNRKAFEEAFAKLSEDDSFTYIDLDGLKYYNDNFGHHRGDDLLREFSILMMNNLDSRTGFFRIAGDEFGIISSTSSAKDVGQIIDQTAGLLRDRGFTLCGASYGQANYDEADSPFNLKKIADARMYSVKTRKKKLAAKTNNN